MQHKPHAQSNKIAPIRQLVSHFRFSRWLVLPSQSKDPQITVKFTPRIQHRGHIHQKQPHLHPSKKLISTGILVIPAHNVPQLPQEHLSRVHLNNPVPWADHKLQRHRVPHLRAVPDRNNPQVQDVINQHHQRARDDLWLPPALIQVNFRILGPMRVPIFL